MLDRSRGRQQPGIESRGILVLLHDFLAFIENALRRVALLAARGLAEKLEDLFKPFDCPSVSS